MTDNTKNIKHSKMDAYIGWFLKWFPDSFVICLGLTVLVAVLAVIFCGTPVYNFSNNNILNYWSDGFWGLLSFAMQLTILLVTGNAVASSPPVKRFLIKIASLPKSKTQVILIAAIVPSILGYIHWGIGMMGGIVMGRELLVQAKMKGIKIHKPTLVSTIFLTIMPTSLGVSCVAHLYSATPGYLKKLVPEQFVERTPDMIPISLTALNPLYLLSAGIALVGCIVIFLLLMDPKDENKIEEIDDDFVKEIMSANTEFEPDRTTPAGKMNNSRIIMYLFGGAALLLSFTNLYQNGFMGLSLNTYNFLMLGLGMILCGNPELYCKHIREGISGTWGFALQFPFYAGIFGIINHSGLGHVIADVFISISNADTLPIFTYIYSSILNLAVPSAGAKFVIEAPYIVPAGLETGTDIYKVICSYVMGDATTHLITPFFALPYLANFKIGFNKVIAYSVPAAGFSALVYMFFLYFIL